MVLSNQEAIHIPTRSTVRSVFTAIVLLQEVRARSEVGFTVSELRSDLRSSLQLGDRGLLLRVLSLELTIRVV
jgi:hypothetical protein